MYDGGAPTAKHTTVVLDAKAVLRAIVIRVQALRMDVQMAIQLIDKSF